MMRDENRLDLPPLPEQAKLAAREGRVIDAIRITRESIDCGLREAKDAVEAYINTRPHHDQYRRRSPESGCRALVVLVAVAMAAAIAYFSLR